MSQIKICDRCKKEMLRKGAGVIYDDGKMFKVGADEELCSACAVQLKQWIAATPSNY
jgi:hypothetical protein